MQYLCPDNNRHNKKVEPTDKNFMLVWLMSTFDTFVISWFYLIGLLLFIIEKKYKNMGLLMSMFSSLLLK